MEQDSKTKDVVDSNLMNGVWVVALCEGSRGYIGRAAGWKKYDDTTREKILDRAPLRLDVAFDYFSQVMRSPAIDPQGRPMMHQGQPAIMVRREPLITGLEFTLSKCPIYVRWTSLIFFDEMQEQDRKVYETFIQAACERNQELRVEKLGLSLASVTDLPGNGKPVHANLDLRDLRK